MKNSDSRPATASIFSFRSNLVQALADLQALSASGKHGDVAVQPIASHNDILHIYQENAKKSNNPQLQFEFCTFLFDYAETLSDYAIRSTYQNEAMEWLRKLAVMALKDDKHLQVQAEAQFYLAECLRLGLYCPCDLQGAWKLYESAAKRGHANSCYRAGICCEQGIGRKVNLSRALLYYRKSAGMIHFPSMFKLITIYVYHAQEYHVNKSAYEGLKWLKIVATHVMNNPVECNVYALACLYELGMWYAEGPPATAPIPDFTLDNEYAIELIYEAGRRGYSPAAFKLGEIFEKGLYGVRSDLSSALFWYRKVLTFNERGEDNFVTLDEWKGSAHRRIGMIQKFLQKNPEYMKRKSASSQGQSKSSHDQIPPPLQSTRQTLSKRKPSESVLYDAHPISEYGQKVLMHLSNKKKLSRKSIPAPINTTHIQRPRPLNTIKKISTSRSQLNEKVQKNLHITSRPPSMIIRSDVVTANRHASVIIHDLVL